MLLCEICDLWHLPLLFPIMHNIWTYCKVSPTTAIDKQMANGGAGFLQECFSHMCLCRTASVMTIQMVFVFLIDRPEYQEMMQHPPWMLLYRRCLDFWQKGLSAASCLHFGISHHGLSSTSSSRCTTVQIILNTPRVHSSNRSGSEICLHSFIICLSNCG